MTTLRLSARKQRWSSLFLTWPLLATWSSRPPDRPAEGRAVRCPESPLEELSAAHRPFFECAGCVVEWGATHEVRPRVAALERQQPPPRGRRTHVSCVLCAPEEASSTHVSPSRWPRTPSVCTHTHTHIWARGVREANPLVNSSRALPPVRQSLTNGP